uniref:Uncharacterized protein n=1 Tax=Amphimedon queenslandica TaxID=400682 RepID=A0A1X7TNM8_AMPQE
YLFLQNQEIGEDLTLVKLSYLLYNLMVAHAYKAKFSANIPELQQRKICKVDTVEH